MKRKKFYKDSLGLQLAALIQILVAIPLSILAANSLALIISLVLSALLSLSALIFHFKAENSADEPIVREEPDYNFTAEKRAEKERNLFYSLARTCILMTLISAISTLIHVIVLKSIATANSLGVKINLCISAIFLLSSIILFVAGKNSDEKGNEIIHYGREKDNKIQEKRDAFYLTGFVLALSAIINAAVAGTLYLENISALAIKILSYIAVLLMLAAIACFIAGRIKGKKTATL